MSIEDLQARILAHATRDPRPGETRAYLIRDDSGDPTGKPVTAYATVPAACPTCGKARGEPTERTVHDACTDTEYRISVWRNSCGHVDLHRDVIAEAKRCVDRAAS